MHTNNPPASIEPVLLPGEQPFSLDMGNEESVRGYLHDSGRGPVGLFVHGFRSHCNGEKSIAFARHAHEQGWSWVRVDLRGHGLSDGDLAEQDVSSALADLEAVLTYMPDRPVMFMGSSMGGWLVLLLALRHRQRLAGMLLIAPAFDYIQKNFSLLPTMVLRQWQADGYMTFPDAYDREPYTLRYALIEDAQQYGVLQSGVQLVCPLHILHGECDVIVPIDSTRQFVQNSQLQRLDFEVVPGGDHRLTEHIPLIIRHLDRLWLEIEK